MEITFEEAEFIKVIFGQALAGANKIEEMKRDDFAAVVAFLGVDDGRTDEVIELLKDQRIQIKSLIKKINEYYGFDDVSSPDNELID